MPNGYWNAHSDLDWYDSVHGYDEPEEWETEPMPAEMTPLKSSNVAAAGWDEDAQELIVQFANGSEYAYPQAGRTAYEDLITAASPGAYVARWLRNQPHRRLS